MDATNWMVFVGVVFGVSGILFSLLDHLDMFRWVGLKTLLKNWRLGNAEQQRMRLIDSIEKLRNKS